MTTTQTHFAFIRAINTGRRRLTNEQIIRPFTRLGFTNVAAYQAAGNVAFLASEPAAADPARITAALSDAFGFEAPTFVRTIGEARATVDEQPFSVDEIAGTDGLIQVAFLADPPGRSTIIEVQGLVPAEDLVVFRGREWFWLPTHGISGSQLPVATIERVLGSMTLRTLGTVSRMVKRFSASSVSPEPGSSPNP